MGSSMKARPLLGGFYHIQAVSIKTIHVDIYPQEKKKNYYLSSNLGSFGKIAISQLLVNDFEWNEAHFKAGIIAF